MRRPPIGAKMIPMMKRVGRTVLGVRIGCHALRRCCLKAVSVEEIVNAKRKNNIYQENELAGRLQPPFSFALSESESCFLRLKRPMAV